MNKSELMLDIWREEREMERTFPDLEILKEVRNDRKRESSTDE